MLSEQETREIQAELRLYEYKRAACVDALKIVQGHRGWVSDEAVQDIAAMLEMSKDELDSVATFYNLIFRKPVGKHVILVCDSISCWVMGYEHIGKYLSERLGIGLGQTTPDGLFTLLPTACLGACDKAPAMMIDDELYGDLTPEKVEEVLKKYK